MIRDTQAAAWRDVQDALPEKRRIVFQMIARHDRGVSLFELVDLLRWPVNSISGRLTELVNANLIEDSGRRAVNPASGKRAIVWQLKPTFNYDQEGQAYFE